MSANRITVRTMDRLPARTDSGQRGRGQQEKGNGSLHGPSACAAVYILCGIGTGEIYNGQNGGHQHRERRRGQKGFADKGRHPGGYSVFQHSVDQYRKYYGQQAGAEEKRGERNSL